MANTPTSSSPIPVHRRPQRPLSVPSSPAPEPSTSPRASRPLSISGRQSVLHETLPTRKSSRSSTAGFSSVGPSFLQGFSNITQGARHAAQVILSHPLARPIVPHLPAPVKSLVNVEGEWSSWVEQGGMGEFESARVYLARWARVRTFLKGGNLGDDDDACELIFFPPVWCVCG